MVDLTELNSSEIDVVNMVASGKLGVEIDIETLASDIPQAEYDREKYHGLYLRFDEDFPLSTIYRSGKYILTGAKSADQLLEARSLVLTELHQVGLLNVAEDSQFAIQNIVCQADLGESVDLNAIMIALGLENTEYEPEQFPGLVYRPEGFECVFLIFSSGKLIITGGSKPNAIVESYHETISELSDFLY